MYIRSSSGWLSHIYLEIICENWMAHTTETVVQTVKTFYITSSSIARMFIEVL